VRVLVAPDSFSGSMTAPQAADAIAEGWRRTAPKDEISSRPLSDGGPGFVAAMAAATGGALHEVPAAGPWGGPAAAQIALVVDHDGPTAYLEVAQVCGPVGDLRGPAGTASSAGLAAPVRHALGLGARRIVVGLGGTLTSDAGAGLLAGLGATAVDANARDVTALMLGGGAGLAAVAAVDLAPARAALAGVDLVIASDVDVPLLGPRGAARGFAPQKGAEPELVAVLESSLTAFAHGCARLPDGRSPAAQLGAGAAGGLGFALLHLGGRRVPGIEWVLGAVGFGEAVAEADLVITGEGCLDWQSVQGKVVSGVCRESMAQGRPVLALAGQSLLARREWMAIGVSGAYTILGDAPTPPDVAEAMAHGRQLLAELSARAARTWSR